MVSVLVVFCVTDSLPFLLSEVLMIQPFFAVPDPTFQFDMDLIPGPDPIVKFQKLSLSY